MSENTQTRPGEGRRIIISDTRGKKETEDKVEGKTLRAVGLLSASVLQLL